MKNKIKLLSMVLSLTTALSAIIPASAMATYSEFETENVISNAVVEPRTLSLTTTSTAYDTAIETTTTTAPSENYDDIDPLIQEIDVTNMEAFTVTLKGTENAYLNAGIQWFGGSGDMDGGFWNEDFRETKFDENGICKIDFIVPDGVTTVTFLVYKSWLYDSSMYEFQQSVELSAIETIERSEADVPVTTTVATTTLPQTTTTTVSGAYTGDTTTANENGAYMSLYIYQMPDKTHYELGEELDLTGGKIQALGRDADGVEWQGIPYDMTTAEEYGFTISTGYNPNIDGIYTVTISYTYEGLAASTEFYVYNGWQETTTACSTTTAPATTTTKACATITTYPTTTTSNNITYTTTTPSYVTGTTTTTVTPNHIDISVEGVVDEFVPDVSITVNGVYYHLIPSYIQHSSSNFDINIFNAVKVGDLVSFSANGYGSETSIFGFYSFEIIDGYVDSVTGTVENIETLEIYPPIHILTIDGTTYVLDTGLIGEVDISNIKVGYTVEMYYVADILTDDPTPYDVYVTELYSIRVIENTILPPNNSKVIIGTVEGIAVAEICPPAYCITIDGVCYDFYTSLTNVEYFEDIEIGDSVAIECYDDDLSDESSSEIVCISEIYGVYILDNSDANCDGTVSIADVVSVLAYVADSNANELSRLGIYNADVHDTGNGLNASDALVIQQRALESVL